MTHTDGHQGGAGRGRMSARSRRSVSARLRTVTTPPQQWDGPAGPPDRSPLGPPVAVPAGPLTGMVAGSLAGPAAPGLPRTERGLFGPDSITWRLHSDPLMGVAGLRALLLQALHPVTMAAVDAHHNSHWDPWQRLVRTTEYVGVTTYGTAAQAMLAGSRLRAVHARIYGTTRTGRPYTAEDPSLLAWVHVCLVASFLEIITRGGLCLTGAEQDAYIAEQVRTATLAGLEPGDVPKDRDGLVAFFRRLRPVLAVTPAAQAAAWSVVSGQEPVRDPGAPVPDRPAWADVAGLAFATLPPWARRLYALPDLPGAARLNESAATVALRALRADLLAAQHAAADGQVS
jgi:uncharacterized protein (DUF2236 family)